MVTANMEYCCLADSHGWMTWTERYRHDPDPNLSGCPSVHVPETLRLLSDWFENVCDCFPYHLSGCSLCYQHCYLWSTACVSALNTSKTSNTLRDLINTPPEYVCPPVCLCVIKPCSERALKVKKKKTSCSDYENVLRHYAAETSQHWSDDQA